MRILLPFFLAVLVAISTHAQVKKKGRLDSLLSRDLKFLPFPYLAVSPEVGVKYGGFVDYFYNACGKNDTVTRPSQAFFQVLYSTRKQLTIEVFNSGFTKNERFYNYFRGGYTNYYEQYWGLTNPTLANDDFAKTRYKRWFANGRLMKNLGHKVFTGIGFNFNNYFDVNFDRKIENVYQPEDPSSNVLGGGLVFTLDRRDNQFSPTQGVYFEVSDIINFDLKSRSYLFNSFNVDARKYVERGRHVWANQLTWGTLSGNVPLFEKYRLGGHLTMRGFFMGRFRDNNLWTAQSEYRYGLSKILKLAYFVSLGATSETPATAFKEQLLFSQGGGFRVLLNKKKKVYARFDVAYTNINTFGYYIKMSDAF